MAQKLTCSVIALVFVSCLSFSGWAATSSPALVATPPQPKWVELNAQQKSVLAPLAADWDSMEAYRRKKWIGMQEWTNLTPEQRRVAREKYQTMSQLPSEKKQELKQKWEEYSNLPEEEKQKHQQQAVSGSVPTPVPALAPPRLQPPAVVVPAETPAAVSGAAHSATESQVGTTVTPTVVPAASVVEADQVPRP
jgi:Protein of unknown function (DUF3106)